MVLNFQTHPYAELRYQICSVSACVIKVRCCWFLVSAGHLVTDLKKYVVDENARIVTCKLFDPSLTENNWPPIPFPIFDAGQPTLIADGVPNFSINEDGNDFLVIGLRPNEIELLAAGGLIPLNESYWEECPETASDYYLVGLPTSLRDGGPTFSSIGLRVRGEHSAMVVPVRPCAAPEGVETETERFYATVPIIEDVWNGKPFSDIGGMSGGPIFACRSVSDSETEYFLFAIQSAWFPTNRIIAACPLKPLAKLIAGKIDAHILATSVSTA